MDPDDLALLNKHHFRLVREMAPEGVVDHLISSGIFLEHHGNEIRKKSGYEEKNRELLKLLKQRGKFALKNFVEALEGTQQYELCKLMPKQSTKADSGQQMQLATSSESQSEGDSFVDKLKKLEHDQYKRALTRSLAYICENLLINEVLTQMETAEVIRTVVSKQIRSEKLDYNQNRELVDYLKKSSRDTFRTFIDALITTGQGQIAQKIADNL
uniref:CARD domain-containing protein n=1 Tax=Plectus sambesii TaxID=2011161 RepID=A0A914VY13_9BILA